MINNPFIVDTKKSGARLPRRSLLSRQDEVASRQRRDDCAEFRLISGGELRLHPFACLGEGDVIERLPGSNEISVVLEHGESTVPLSPVWSSVYFVDVGTQRVRLTIKEVETAAESAALANLKRYHYRGEKTAGRAVPLIAVASHRLLPEVIGFVEITSALLVNSARRLILDRPYSDKERGVTWQRWDMNSAKLHTSRLARISRCVVYPELRGLGIASKLARAAAAYATERWHFGGVRPLFLEITADMLRYSPFVKSAGFAYVGETEGNENRMLRDMRYLLNRTIASGSNDDFPQGGGGIMSLQRSYATTLLGVMQRRKLGLEQLLKLLRQSPESLSDDEWIALHRVFRRPKPTYMSGLTKSAAGHLKTFAALCKQESPALADATARNTRQRNAVPLAVQNLSISTSVSPSGSPRSRKVAEAFGVVSKRLDTTVVGGLDLTVAAGEVVLITGPSGTGKSLVLKVLSAVLRGDKDGIPPGVSYQVDALRGAKSLEWLRALPTDAAPVDMLGHVPLERALSILADAGLAEAALFVRPSSSFSDGQKYRLALASALSAEPDLLFIDAFCEPLDDLSAAAVCKNLRDRTRRTGLSALVATAAPDRLLSALQPDKIVQLLPGGSVRAIDRSSFEPSKP